MCNKKPSVVVTDGCEPMKAAIKAVFPEATHRLCAWLMEKNVTSNVKDDGLRELFNKWLYAEMEIEEFEAGWEVAMSEYEIGNSFWFNDTYDRRCMWANAYLHDKFCAGFRTTSRCEGINANVKKFLKSRHSIPEMLQNLELVVREYRNNEVVAQFKSIHGFSVLTTCLDPLERNAALVYTREIFFDVKKEIEGIATVILVLRIRCSTTMVYTLEEYGDPDRHMRVLFDRTLKKIQCPCHFWKKKGFPCRHMFFVMKHEHLREIPYQLVLKRWRKDAKSLNKYVETLDDVSERSMLLCHGALHSASQWLLYLGEKSPAVFMKTMAGLRTLCEEVETDLKADNIEKKVESGKKVKDLVIVRTKGAPRLPKKSKGRKHRCTNCRRLGRTKRHCMEARSKDKEPQGLSGDDVVEIGS